MHVLYDFSPSFGFGTMNPLKINTITMQIIIQYSFLNLVYTFVNEFSSNIQNNETIDMVAGMHYVHCPNFHFSPPL